MGDHDGIYLPHVRSRDHFVNDAGASTAVWWLSRARGTRPNGKTFNHSDGMAAVLECPPSVGKTASFDRRRQGKQICQSAAPMDYQAYAQSKEERNLLTPERPGPHERTVKHRTQLTDPHRRPTPRIIEKQEWASRRGEGYLEPQPPAESEMFRTVDQLRTEVDLDLHGAKIAQAMQRRAQSLGVTPRGVAADILHVSLRSRLEGGVAKEAHQRSRHARTRLVPSHAREISSWDVVQDKLKRDDRYFSKPMTQSGSSGVKYDIITNQMKDFWY